MKKLWAVLVVVIAVAVGARLLTDHSGGTASASATPKVDEPKPVKLVDMQWKTGGFGAVAIASFTLNNPNGFEVKDVVISCAFYGESGTKINSHVSTVYQKIPAHGKKAVEDFNVGFIDPQAKRGGCAADGYQYFDGPFIGH
jgi:hypothetical protein